MLFLIILGDCLPALLVVSSAENLFDEINLTTFRRVWLFRKKIPNNMPGEFKVLECCIVDSVDFSTFLDVCRDAVYWWILAS